MKWALTVLSLPLLALAACSSPKEEQPKAQSSLNEVMKNEVDPRADDVWAIGNKAMDDQAGIDPKLMTDADWDNLAKHAQSLQQAALDLAALDPIVVVKPGVKIADEGVPYGDSAAEVQSNVDKDPQGLRDFANTLASHMGDVAAAAQAHDAVKAGPLISQLDGVCESCHINYWYPSQKALLEKINGAVTDPTTKDAP